MVRICAKQTQFSPKGGPRGSQSCKTNPISRLRIGPRLAAGHPLGPAASAPAGQSRKTKPICRSRQRAGVGRLCKTNPIWGVDRLDPGTCCTDKASFAARPIVRKKANFPEPSPRGSQSCETNPISPAGAGLGGRRANVQNKPNSQWTRYPIIPLFYHSTIPVRCRLCRTNPISRRGRVGRGLGDEGQTCKTNPIPAGTGWDEAKGAWDAGQPCKTKPISPAGMGPAVRGAAQWAEVSHHSTIPSFQDSIAAPAPTGLSRKTNPIPGAGPYAGPPRKPSW